jgi:hypothetical protein
MREHRSTRSRGARGALMASRVQHKESSFGSGTTSPKTVVFDAGTAAGNLIRIRVKYEGASRTLSSLSDGTSSLTTPGQTDHANGDLHSAEFYLLAANASKTTFTLSWTGGNVDFLSIMAEEWAGSTSGTWSLDGTPAAHASSGDSTLTSGNVTTTGTEGVAFFGYAEYSTIAIVAATINSVDVLGNLIQLSGNTYSATSYLTYSSGFTGQATATLTGSAQDPYILGLTAFAFTPSGGTPKSLLWRPPSMGALLQM